jgi:CMP-N,N'-diacetyllegionaminic acid synthase
MTVTNHSSIKSKVLIVGFGSAGQRHAKNSELLGFDVVIVTSSISTEYPCYKTLGEAIQKNTFKFVIISTPTNKHSSELKVCIEHNIPCLVEKPLAISLIDLRKTVKKIPDNYICSVGYLLRYHPIIKLLVKELPKLGVLYDSSISFGHYLPWWRPNTDYSKCYSAYINQGGGVLLDSSHEIDLIYYLFGVVSSLVAVSGNFSNLDIDSDDECFAIFRMASKQVVQLRLDYLNKIPERKIVINGKNGSIVADLMKEEYHSNINSVERKESFSIDRNQIFIDELMDFSHKYNECLLPNLNDSIYILKIIDTIRKSNIEEKWIKI